MIIDRVRTAGAGAYLLRNATPDDVNLAGPTPSFGRTGPPARGQQLDITGLQFVIDGDDLWPLFDPAPALDAETPLVGITVMKEVFPGLFADPHRHRVHTVAGFDDFNSGTYTNCQAMDIDGIPTLVSLGAGGCQWASPVLLVPLESQFVSAAWELATTRRTPADSFEYSLTLRTWAPGQALTTAPQAEIGRAHV